MEYREYLKEKISDLDYDMKIDIFLKNSTTSFSIKRALKCKLYKNGIIIQDSNEESYILYSEISYITTSILTPVVEK